MTETYIPLLRMMQRLISDGVPFKLTMSITPTLCAMLQDQLLRERYVRHLELLIDLAEREQKRTRKDPQLHQLANFYFELFSENHRFFVEECKYDLLSVFQRLAQTGALEIIASAATHGLLPIVQQQSRQAARAQVLIGRDMHIDVFGIEPAGFWLPECGYAPGLECTLQEANLDGLCSMHTDCSLQSRARAVRSMRPVIPRRDRPPSPGILMQADKSGVQTKVIRVIQFTGNFIATSVLICQLNTWDPLHAEPENSPG